jgi:hypothetical protein
MKQAGAKPVFAFGFSGLFNPGKNGKFKKLF